MSTLTEQKELTEKLVCASKAYYNGLPSIMSDIEFDKIGSDISKDMPDEFFEHTYRAMKDYGMSVYDADKWAWLNTLFGYDIGADRALGLITWYDDNGMDVLELTAGDKETLKNVAEMELGFHFNYAAFAPYTPDAISYSWPDHI